MVIVNPHLSNIETDRYFVWNQWLDKGRKPFSALQNWSRSTQRSSQGHMPDKLLMGCEGCTLELVLNCTQAREDNSWLVLGQLAIQVLAHVVLCFCNPISDLDAVDHFALSNEFGVILQVWPYNMYLWEDNSCCISCCQYLKIKFCFQPDFRCWKNGKCSFSQTYWHMASEH